MQIAYGVKQDTSHRSLKKREPGGGAQCQSSAQKLCLLRIWPIPGSAQQSLLEVLPLMFQVQDVDSMGKLVHHHRPVFGNFCWDLLAA